MQRIIATLVECHSRLTALIKAAKMAPRNSPVSAMIYDREKQKANANRTTLAVARKMVVYLVTLDRRQKDFLVIENDNCTAAYEARIKIKKSKTPNEELLRGLDSISSLN